MHAEVNASQDARPVIGRLNHVGVATPSIVQSATVYRELFGASAISPVRILAEQGVSVAFVQLPNTEIELIEPYGDSSPLDGFLARHPRGGQHHVCFEVDDILVARDTLIARGARVLGSGNPRIGAHGQPVLFLDPKTAGGLLVELMQAPGSA